MTTYGIQNRQSVARPRSVDVAVKLMWFGAALEVVDFVLSLLIIFHVFDPASRRDPEFERLLPLTIIGAIMALSWFLIAVSLWAVHAWANGKGMHWARITGTVLGLLTVAASTWMVANTRWAGLNQVDLVIELGTIVLAVVLIWLMWRGENRAFYA
ncbi:hypothetical protein [Kytococcus sedentarius]|uniref:hypothetical protein n=1 Tax=Kytococcus sedentarius TaxID=1276 RepID=UPI0035BBF2C2